MVSVPTTSVCVPTFSRPHLLRETLESVLAQTQPDFEVVVGDNGSLGKAVIEELHDPRLRYLQHDRNLGMAGNWNAILDYARGEYLGLLMDDDRWHPEFLAQMTSVLDRDGDGDIGVVFSNHTIDNGRRVTVRRELLQEGTHRDFICEFLRVRPVAASGAVYRRACWQVARPLPDTAAADMVLFSRIADAGYAFHYVNAPLMTYRAHQSALSGSPEFRDDVVKAWESLQLRNRSARNLRDHLLARALVSRASLAIQEDRLDDARADLRRARELPGRCCQAWALACIAGNRPAAMFATKVARVRRTFRAVGVRTKQVMDVR